MTRLRLKIVSLCLLTIFAFSCSERNSVQGYLFIIGGGHRPDYLMEKIIQLAGGTDSKVIIIPNASSRPSETADYQMNQFRDLGVTDCDYVYVKDSLANADKTLEKVSNADIIFFSGGDQSRLTTDLNGTRLLETIHERYRKGAVIAGTSAGAAVMSEIMITGDELINTDSTRSFYTIQQGNIATTAGFGFITDAIIDQHFITRKRHNRLISLVLENPDLLGIGIDESTAIIVNPDLTFDVIGEHGVIIYDASQAKSIQLDSHQQFSAETLKIHLLTSGQRYHLVKRRIIH